MLPEIDSLAWKYLVDVVTDYYDFRPSDVFGIAIVNGKLNFEPVWIKYSETTFINRIKVSYTRWTRDGKIMIQYKCKDGKKHGPYEHVDSDGSRTVTIYDCGNDTGTFTKWNENGFVVHSATNTEINFKHVHNSGLGLYESWYNNGKRQEKVYYKDNKMHGKNIEWYPNGQIKSKSYYKNNMISGRYKYWHQSGHLAIDSYYVNGNMYGPYTEWYENGKIKECRNYRYGRPYGVVTSYHKNGYKARIINYKNRTVYGESWEYNEYGNLTKHVFNLCIPQNEGVNSISLDYDDV